MSQYQLKGDTPNGKLNVLIGWDEPMSWFYMVIEADNEVDEPLYSNLYEAQPEALTLEHFGQVLKRFNIKNISLAPEHESGLYNMLMRDQAEKRMS